ncbi:MAG: substrate-binding domain-containing protein [Pseudomonadota bacterium]
MKKAIAIVLALALFGCAPPEDAVRVVGSSTVFPFSRTVAEHYAAKTGYRAPVVEMTGTGGGMQIFCAAQSPVHVANASRPIKKSEIDICAAAGAVGVLEFRIGYDGIVIVAARENPLKSLTLDQLYRAIAKDLPVANGFAPNPHELWSEVDPALPAIPIQMHGPPPTSGTRDAFVEIALETGAKGTGALRYLAQTDKGAFAARAGALREDGRWVDEGENDNAIIQIIRNSSNALGVFGYSFYEQNRALLDGVAVNGAAPEFEAIADGRYPLARSLYFYVDPARADEHVGAYVMEFMSESAIGPYGYLIDKGLIPASESERRAGRERARGLVTQIAVKVENPERRTANDQ